MESKVTLDTHSLVWFLDKDLRIRLSNRALQEIRKATSRSFQFPSHNFVSIYQSQVSRGI